MFRRNDWPVVVVKPQPWPGAKMEMTRVIWGFLQKSSDSRTRTVLCILNGNWENNDLAWIGRWNGRNHGGLENASAPDEKMDPPGNFTMFFSPTRERISLSEESSSLHFQILP